MAFDGDARGRVSEVNAVVGFIYFLAASPASADKAFLQIPVSYTHLDVYKRQV